MVNEPLGASLELASLSVKVPAQVTVVEPPALSVHVTGGLLLSDEKASLPEMAEPSLAMVPVISAVGHLVTSLRSGMLSWESWEVAENAPLTGVRLAFAAEAAIAMLASMPAVSSRLRVMEVFIEVLFS